MINLMAILLHRQQRIVPYRVVYNFKHQLLIEYFSLSNGSLIYTIPNMATIDISDTFPVYMLGLLIQSIGGPLPHISLGLTDKLHTVIVAKAVNTNYSFVKWKASEFAGIDLHNIRSIVFQFINISGSADSLVSTGEILSPVTTTIEDYFNNIQYPGNTRIIGRWTPVNSNRYITLTGNMNVTASGIMQFDTLQGQSGYLQYIPRENIYLISNTIFRLIDLVLTEIDPAGGTISLKFSDTGGANNTSTRNITSLTTKHADWNRSDFPHIKWDGIILIQISIKGIKGRAGAFLGY